MDFESGKRNKRYCFETHAHKLVCDFKALLAESDDRILGMSGMWLSLFAITFAYVIGSVPIGYIVIRLRTKRDLRSVGTGNVGAYNVLKQMGPAASVLVTLLDMGKGIAGFKLAEWIGAPEGVGYACAAAVIIGHVYPVFLNFKGGTGVAPGMGITAAVAPVYTAISFAVGLAAGLPTKIPPVGIFVGLLVLNTLSIVEGEPKQIFIIFTVTLLVIMAHLLKKYRQVKSGLKKASWREIF